MRSTGTLKNRAAAFTTGPPDSFMYVSGFASTTGRAGEPSLEDLAP